MTVSTTTPRRLAQAIRRAETILPGEEAASGKRDPRWQAIIRIGAFVETHPEPVWEFALKWGKHADADLRTAVACCLLEHLLEHHFELVFPRAERAARQSKRFADTLCRCSLFGQSLDAENAARFLRLKRRIRRKKLRSR